MKIFTRAYESFPSFVATACHSHAHRVGDLAYYELYFMDRNLDALEFPQSTTACGYGFFHGFLEHLIQDHPDPAFVTKTCDFLVSRLDSRMGDIQLTCYHGAGHGFALAEAEKVPRSRWGDVRAFTDEPLMKCDALTHASGVDIEQCKEGIFNVINLWMVAGEYGFAFDAERPFEECAKVRHSALQACYYEMAQKIDAVANFDPRQLLDIVSVIPQEKYRLMALRVGIAGIVQNVIWRDRGIENLLTSCSALSSDVYELCVRSVIGGLFEHGLPQGEYKRALATCQSSSVVDYGGMKVCYDAIASRLKRFYAPEVRMSVCHKFPEEFADMCMERVRSS